MPVAIRIIAQQPVAKQWAYFQRQAKQDVACFRRPRRMAGIQNSFYLMVVQRRNDRRSHDRSRYAGIRQRLDRFQPLGRCRGTGFHRSGELAIQCRHRNPDFGEAFRGHVGKDVDIAHDQRRLRHDHHRMIGRLQHFEDLAHDPPFPLNRLIGIGIGADRNCPHLVIRPAQLPFQKPRHVRLGK
ncbi:hypothetical protein D3C87_1421180 [compost metagenome]